jgi:hypothetical protein
MPISFVKILVHGADIVSGAIMLANSPRKPRNLEIRFASTVEEFIREEHLGHQRKAFLIYFWFPPVHLARV